MKKNFGYILALLMLVVAVKPTPQSVVVKPTPSGPTRTARPPKGATPTIVPTITATAAPSNSMQSWHPVGSHDGLNVHEHGDQPPAWAHGFSNDNFGHGVIFGGDEASSPMENIMKHQAFKGMRIMLGVGTSCPSEGYLRTHNSSNPADRSSAFHSTEVYVKDCAGNISFWQRLIWVGYPGYSIYRLSVDDPNLRHDFAIIAPAEGMENLNEQWYGSTYAWDISNLFVDSGSTFFTLGEYLNDPMNPATWNLTGEVGLIRNMGAVHRGFRERVLLNQWYCVQKFPSHIVSGNPDIGTPQWGLTGAVSGPDACPDGYLPEFVSSTFPQGAQGNIEKHFPGVGVVTVPN